MIFRRNPRVVIIDRSFFAIIVRRKLVNIESENFRLDFERAILSPHAHARRVRTRPMPLRRVRVRRAARRSERKRANRDNERRHRRKKDFS